jgi:signal transduction histidine kinase
MILPVLSYLLVVCSLICFFNAIFAGYLYLKQRRPLHKSLFFIWTSALLPFLTQWPLNGNDLQRILSFSTSIGLFLALSQFAATMVPVRVPWARSLLLHAAGVAASCFLYSRGKSFTLVALPVALTMVYPVFCTTLPIFVKFWGRLSFSGKGYILTAFLTALHFLDYPFLRMVESFAPIGYTIFILQVFAITVFTNTVALENYSELDRLKSQFVSHVSHELRTPLTSVKGSIDNLLDGVLGSLTEKQTKTLERARRSAQELERIIADILDISKIEAGKMDMQIASFRLDALADECLESLVLSPGISIRRAFLGPVTVLADRNRVKQVLLNLLENAVKFTPAGEIAVNIIPDHAQALIRVSDTGCGIPKAALEKVFDKFFQVERTEGRRMKGSGLGLAICKHLVELMGGRIWVESDSGGGSRFAFTLPMPPHLQGKGPL